MDTNTLPPPAPGTTGEWPDVDTYGLYSDTDPELFSILDRACQQVVEEIVNKKVIPADSWALADRVLDVASDLAPGRLADLRNAGYGDTEVRESVQDTIESRIEALG